MNVISCDDEFVWWILMFGYLQLRKWDPGINWLDKLCGKTFSLKGVQCKQWDPGIACFGETLQAGLMEQFNIFFHNGCMLLVSYMMNKFAALWSVSA